LKKFIIILFAIFVLSQASLGQARENPFGGSREIWQEETPSERPPSKWTAAGLSLLVPGAGQMYLGNTSTAKYFFAGEGAIWGAFAGYRILGNWRKEQYRNFAAIHAGIRPEGKDDEFFEDLLYFYSRDQFNYWMHLIYRGNVPLYPETDEFFWEWKTSSAMDEYADLRSSSEKAYRSARTMLGVALVNRVISVVDVFRTDVHSLGDDAIGDSGELIPQAYLGQSSDGTPSFGLRVVKNF